MIGPTETTPIRPKPSVLAARLSLRSSVTPSAIAMMNGTVMAPVVAPDASKAMARNSSEAFRASRNTMAYSPIRSLWRTMLRMIRISPSANSAAMPIETTRMMGHFATLPVVRRSTCPARMCRSGSAMEIMKPSARPAPARIMQLAVLEKVRPIALPIMLTLKSMPCRKIASPAVMQMAPRRKRPSCKAVSGVKVACSTRTIAMMGRTACSTSRTFDRNSFIGGTAFLGMAFEVVILLPL